MVHFCPLVVHSLMTHFKIKSPFTSVVFPTAVTGDVRGVSSCSTQSQTWSYFFIMQKHNRNESQLALSLRKGEFLSVHLPSSKAGGYSDNVDAAFQQPRCTRGQAIPHLHRELQGQLIASYSGHRFHKGVWVKRQFQKLSWQLTLAQPSRQFRTV